MMLKTPLQHVGGEDLVSEAELVDVLRRVGEWYLAGQSHDTEAAEEGSTGSGSGSSSGCDGTEGATSEGGNTQRGPEDLSPVPPCEHNAWLRVRNLRRNPGVRLRCHMCGAKWHTRMSFHEKCTKFYSGVCDGSCGRPHVYARGLEPTQAQDDTGAVSPSSQVTLRSLKKQRMKKRALGSQCASQEDAHPMADAAAPAPEQ